MKLLFENWRKYLLTEAAKAPEDLPPDVYVRIKKKGSGHIFYSDKNGNQIGELQARRSEGALVNGEIAIGTPTGLADDFEVGKCLGAKMIIWSEALKGWGPMLYDIALEFVGDQGLMADRTSLSDDAYNVWTHYMNSRSDVQKKQLDTMNNTLTPDDADNCNTGIARKFDDSFDGDEEMISQALADSPVMKVYTKGAGTIEKLEAMGKLIRK